MNEASNSRWLICRICLKDEKKLYNIFEPITEDEIKDLGTTLQDKIELCGGIKLCQQNSLPSKICKRCVLLLRASCKFRDLCQESQNQLKQFMTIIQKEEVESPDIIFDSDAEEQKAEVQEEGENVLMADGEYMVEENVEEYNLSDDQLNMPAKTDNYISTIEEDEQFHGFSEGEDPQYVVEEVDAKQFISEDNEDEITTYKYEEDLHSDNIIIEEQPKKQRRIFIKRVNEKKLPGKRKRKSSQDGSVNEVYNCTLCDNTYTEKAKYNNHMKIHVKDKPHECEICRKRFSTTPQLSRHMNSHTGNRPYKCQYCEASFGDPSTKIKHERIHTNERPYKCILCEKAFAYSNVLKVHMMTHTGEKPHICEYCGKNFSQLHHKNAHEKRHTNSANMVIVHNSPDIEYMEEEEEELKEYKIEEII